MDKTTLEKYKKQNPIKFAHKYGEIDLDSVPEGFDFAKYKKNVVAERVWREQNGFPQYDPKRLITPELFVPKVANVEKVAAPVADEKPKAKRAKKVA